MRWHLREKRRDPDGGREFRGAEMDSGQGTGVSLGHGKELAFHSEFGGEATEGLQQGPVCMARRSCRAAQVRH